MDKADPIFVAGHRGMIGSAVCRLLSALGYSNVIVRTRNQLDLGDRAAVERFFAEVRPAYVVLAAGMTGGILENTQRPADLLAVNLAIQSGVLGSAAKHGTRRLIFLGSSCVYPKEAPQPMRESCLLSGPVERTSQSYALAKLAGLEYCRALNLQYGARFLGVIPASVYGPNDNFDPASAHVLGAMVSKFSAVASARGPDPVVGLFGSGAPRREFIFVDDLARALVYLLDLGEEQYGRLLDSDGGVVNIGTGTDVSIRELADTVGRLSGFRGRIEFDAGKPDGAFRKLLDSGKILGLGWQPGVTLEDGISRTLTWFNSQRKAG